MNKETVDRERKVARYVVTHSELFKQSYVGLAWGFLRTWGAKDA